MTPFFPSHLFFFKDTIDTTHSVLLVKFPLNIFNGREESPRILEAFSLIKVKDEIIFSHFSDGLFVFSSSLSSVTAAILGCATYDSVHGLLLQWRRPDTHVFELVFTHREFIDTSLQKTPAAWTGIRKHFYGRLTLKGTLQTHMKTLVCLATIRPQNNPECNSPSV